MAWFVIALLIYVLGSLILFTFYKKGRFLFYLTSWVGLVYLYIDKQAQEHVKKILGGECDEDQHRDSRTKDN